MKTEFYMKILIFAGFLGSGKTTVLLQVARHLMRHSREMVIIENEIGEIGIDGQYLDLHGLKVQELFGGCVCCTLSVGLIETINRICSHGSPDWIVLEATGIARPIDITRHLHRLETKVDSVHVITVVDAGRYEMLMEAMTPLITSQVESADTIIINKTDQATSSKVSQISEDIRHLNAGAAIVTRSVHKNHSLDELLANLMEMDK